MSAREVAGVNLVRADQRGRLMSGFMGISSTGMALGPALGGLVTELVNFPDGVYHLHRAGRRGAAGCLSQRGQQPGGGFFAGCPGAGRVEAAGFIPAAARCRVGQPVEEHFAGTAGDLRCAGVRHPR